MEENNTESEKLNILKELLVDESHTIEDLKRLVNKSKPFIKIESNSGKILISPEFPFNIVEKVMLYLIGVYFSKEMGLNEGLQVTLRDISESIHEMPTSTSGPLGGLINKHIVKREENSYSIRYHEIENQLDILTEKYLVLKEFKESKDVKKIKRPKSRKKLLSHQDKPSVIKKKEFNEENFNQAIQRYKLKKEDVNSIFNVDKDFIILIRGFKGSNLIETHIKSTLLVLTANQLYFSLDETDASELRRALENSGVDKLVSLSTSIKKFPSLIIHKRGPIGSINNSYKLTNLGLQKGITIIKDVLNNTKNFSIPTKTKIKKEVAPSISIEKEKLDKNISEFAKLHDLSEEKLKTTFDFQTDNLRFLKKIDENSRKVIQITLLMVLGVILKRVYYIDSFNGKKLLRDSHMSADRLDLLDSNKDYQTYFSKKPKSAMQLTYAGELKALEMLKKVLED